MKKAFDKVIEQLEEEKKGYSELASEQFRQRNGRLAYVYKEKELAINYAIEIVNQVADEEENDCCEWKNAGISDNWKPSCEPNSTYNVFGVAWFKRCPYCGKKIKVVE